MVYTKGHLTHYISAYGMESVKRRSAETYSQTSSFQREVGRKLISKLTIPKGAKILDLGCGTGETTTNLSELVGPEGKIVAVDPDAERIKFAKNNNGRANIEFVVGNDETFPEDQYDAVFLNCVIHWIVDKFALYQRVYDNLQPGGSFAFTTNDRDHEIQPVIRNLFAIIHPRFFEDIYWDKTHLVKLDLYKELQKSTAFVSHISEFERVYVYCENADVCLDWYLEDMQGGINLSSVDQEMLQAFKKDHDEDIRNNPMPFDMLFVVLKKYP